MSDTPDKATTNDEATPPKEEPDEPEEFRAKMDQARREYFAARDELLKLARQK